MIDRDWFCLALRLFGIWLLIHSVETVVLYILSLLPLTGNLGGQLVSYVAGMMLWIIVRTAIGVALTLFAPAIAARFYPSAATQIVAPAEHESKPLKVGLQLLGVYALLLATQSGAGVIIGILSSHEGPHRGVDFGEGNYMESLLSFGLNLTFAAILLIWNEHVVALIEKFRYIPERDAYERPPLNE